MQSVRTRYSHIARYYDAFYGVWFARGSRTLIDLRRPAPSERVLEVGAGTGFALPHYPPGVRVTAVDVCPEMLGVAARKRLPTAPAAIDLVTMDAHNLGFVDDVFQLVLFPHSLGLMQDPPRVLAEIARITKSDAELRILHTFEWSNPLLHRFQATLYDVAEDRFGWGRPLQFEPTVKWCRKVGFELTREHRLGVRGWKTILVFRKT